MLTTKASTLPEASLKEGAGPMPLEDGDRMNPYLFIVGCPRSGTTLLQRLVDAHPQMAVTPETHWIPRWFHKKLAKGVTPEGLVTKKFLQKLFLYPRFLELGIKPKEVKKMIVGGERIPYARLVGGLFDLYGQRQGKPIVGDKTPGYARELPSLHALWPTARFVHLIRDGRDVCLSILSWKRARNWKVGEGAARFRGWNEDPVGTAALWWEWHVRLAREAGQELGGEVYYELRYEALVSRPAVECRALCAFLGVPHDDRMLLSYEARVRDCPEQDAKHPWMPITRGLRDWQSQMPATDVKRFEAVAGMMLDELGYRRAAPQPQLEEVRQAARAREWFAHDAHSQRYSIPKCW